MGIFAAIASIIIGIVYAYAQTEQVSQQAANAAHLQKMNNAFTHQENEDIMNTQQELHEFNTRNDYLLKFQGMTDIGMSEAGALQALAGAPSVGYSPTAGGSSATGTSGTSLPNLNGFQSIQDAINSYFTNIEKESNVKRNESDVAINAQYIEESNKRIEKLGFDMDMDKQQLELTKQLNASIIGKNEAERDLNIKKLDEINQGIQESLARVRNLDAQTINEYLRSSLLVSQTENIQADTALKGAETAKVQAEAIGQGISNLDSDIQLAFKQARLEASRILGADVDAPIVTQYLEMCAFGRYDSMSALIAGKRVDSDGALGMVERLGVNMKVNSWNRKRDFKNMFNGKHPVNEYQPSWLFSPSMQPYWNP